MLSFYLSIICNSWFVPDYFVSKVVMYSIYCSKSIDCWIITELSAIISMQWHARLRAVRYSINSPSSPQVVVAFSGHLSCRRDVRLSSCWVALGHGSGRLSLGIGDPFDIRGPSLQALTLFKGVSLIARHLRQPSLGECQQGPRYFGDCRARLGYGPAPGPTLKKALCYTCPVVGQITNT